MVLRSLHHGVALQTPWCSERYSMVLRAQHHAVTRKNPAAAPKPRFGRFTVMGRIAANGPFQCVQGLWKLDWRTSPAHGAGPQAVVPCTSCQPCKPALKKACCGRRRPGRSGRVSGLASLSSAGPIPVAGISIALRWVARTKTWLSLRMVSGAGPTRWMLRIVREAGLRSGGQTSPPLVRPTAADHLGRTPRIPGQRGAGAAPHRSWR